MEIFMKMTRGSGFDPEGDILLTRKNCTGAHSHPVSSAPITLTHIGLGKKGNKVGLFVGSSRCGLSVLPGRIAN